jgi:two-component system nitrogen regulation response regulator NtrX
MQNYDWPGNIRELKNIMERMAIISVGSTIDSSHLPEMILRSSLSGTGAEGASGLASENHSLKEARDEFERVFILKKLDENDWNITRTAEAIDLERTNLHRKIRSYGIEMKHGAAR